jgi:hypothetical protein
MGAGSRLGCPAKVFGPLDGLQCLLLLGMKLGIDVCGRGILSERG